MKLFGNMDLYKAIILASFVLLPGAGGWVYWLQGKITITKDALGLAKKQTQEIGELQKQMETVHQNQGKTDVANADDPGQYFQRIILSSVQGGGISMEDFNLESSTRSEIPVQVGKGKAIDSEVGIVFGKPGVRDYKMSRDFLFAVIYNVEQQQIWKLRSLEMSNASVEKEAGSSKTPEKELDDKAWVVKQLRFVKRKPEKQPEKQAPPK